MVRTVIWLILAFCSVFAFNSAAADHPASPASAPHEVFAPYWTAEPGWDTDFQMRNALPSASLRK